MNLTESQRVAEQVRVALAPYCDRIEVAGSVRREKPEVKDVEICFITSVVSRRVNLFEEDKVPAISVGVLDLVESGVLSWDLEVKRNGPKYKRLIHNESGMVIELFGGTPQNWGLVYAVRTGPGGFNHCIVSAKAIGGAMPHGMRMKDGRLWYLGHALPTPDEETYFKFLNLPLWPPQERDGDKLHCWLSEQPAERWNPKEAHRWVMEQG